MTLSRLDVLAMMSEGEGPTLEFKQDISQRSDFAGELTALANTDGGYVLLGVADDGHVVGVADVEIAMQQVASICRDNCRPPLYPDVQALRMNGETVIAIQVDRRLGPPYENNSGQCFIRVGRTKQLASPQQRSRLLQRAGLYHFDETPVEQTTLADLDRDAFREYFRLAARQEVEDASVLWEQLLEQTRVAITVEGVQRLTVAGLLVFGRRPQDYMRQSRISVARFLGDMVNVDQFEKPYDLKGTLPELVDQAERYIAERTGSLSSIRGVRRIDLPRYPPRAVREAVVNAVAHRDYSISGSQIRVFIFDHRIEFRSPGRLPNTMTLDQIRGYNHEARNHLITQFLHRLGIMEDFGIGIPTMIEEMRKHNGTEPEFTLEGEEFVVRLLATGADILSGSEFRANGVKPLGGRRG